MRGGRLNLLVVHLLGLLLEGIFPVRQAEALRFERRMGLGYRLSQSLHPDQLNFEELVLQIVREYEEGLKVP